MQKKVSMLGSFAVGKTSLVRRFVSGIFSDRYQTTVGVKIDKRELVVDGRQVSLILWDLHGDDEFQRIRPSYLRGSSGYLLVVDGTRKSTLDAVIGLQKDTEELLGDIPFLLLVNKSDLAAEWEIEDAALQQLRDRGWQIRQTSAKSGDCVGEAFEELAQRMLAP